MLYSMGKCYSDDQDRISTVTSRYDKHSQSDRICRNKICVSRTFRLDFASIREKKVTLPDGKILKYAVPVCLAQTVGQYFFFYIGVAHTSGVKCGIITVLVNFIAILM